VIKEKHDEVNSGTSHKRTQDEGIACENGALDESPDGEENNASESTAIVDLQSVDDKECNEVQRIELHVARRKMFVARVLEKRLVRGQAVLDETCDKEHEDCVEMGQPGEPMKKKAAKRE